MALRTIRIQGDPVLTKVCRPIPEVTDRIRTLAEDMLETMYEANGVGLAAPQVGDEGCLSLPGKAGQVTRPNHVKAKFYDLDMNEWEVEGEGLMARCICHELDHLDGHMYTEKVEGGLHDVNYEEPEEE